MASRPALSPFAVSMLKSGAYEARGRLLWGPNFFMYMLIEACVCVCTLSTLQKKKKKRLEFNQLDEKKHVVAPKGL